MAVESTESIVDVEEQSDVALDPNAESDSFELAPVAQLTDTDLADFRRAVEPVLAQAHYLLASGQIDDEIEAEMLRTNLQWLQARAMLGDLSTGISSHAAAPIFFELAVATSRYSPTDEDALVDDINAELTRVVSTRSYDDPDLPLEVAEAIDERTNGRISRGAILKGFASGSAALAVGSLIADVGVRAAGAVFGVALLASILMVIALTWRDVRDTH